jgi:tRNA pseudouridine55 synthase
MTTTSSGLVIVNKPGGLTSHDVVGRVRRIYRTRKVGHAGTLDPMATGVLVVGVNRATRLLGHLTRATKQYEATIRLGQASHTDDAEGEITSNAPTDTVTASHITRELNTFRGVIQQIPSSVSAIKIQGERAYARVRAGEAVKLAPREVIISYLELREIRRVDDFVDVDVSIECSSGTYIRAIARDLGSQLGVGGHLTVLNRTQVGPFSLFEARDISTIEQDCALIGLDDAARRYFPSVTLSPEAAHGAKFGRSLPLTISGLTAVFAPDHSFLALYEPVGHNLANPVAVFVGN